MGWYTVTLDCPHCGRQHTVIGGLWGRLQIEDGPDREGTIAQLYAGRDLPGAMLELLNRKVWCDGVQDYVLLGDPSRVILEPRPHLPSDLP